MVSDISIFLNSAGRLKSIKVYFVKMDLDDDILIHLNIPCVYMNVCNFKAQSVRGRIVKTGFKTVTAYDFLVQHSA